MFVGIVFGNTLTSFNIPCGPVTPFIFRLSNHIQDSYIYWPISQQLSACVRFLRYQYLVASSLIGLLIIWSLVWPYMERR